MIPWPDTLGAHNATVGPDAKKVYASFGVQEADITDLDNPSAWTARTSPATVLAQVHPLRAVLGTATAFRVRSPDPAMSHEVELNASGTRMYIAGQQEYQGTNPAHPRYDSGPAAHLLSNTVGRAGHGIGG